jgi:hypothetical protein
LTCRRKAACRTSNHRKEANIHGPANRRLPQVCPEEILPELWNRCDEALDGNMTAITACMAGPGEWSAVNNQFIAEINDHIWSPAKKAAYRRVENAAVRKKELPWTGGP